MSYDECNTTVNGMCIVNVVFFKTKHCLVFALSMLYGAQRNTKILFGQSLFAIILKVFMFHYSASVY